MTNLNYVKIKSGTYPKTKSDTVFSSSPFNVGKKGAFITVNGSEVMGDKFASIRVLIEDTQKTWSITGVYAEQLKIDNTPKDEETDEQAIERTSNVLIFWTE